MGKFNRGKKCSDDDRLAKRKSNGLISSLFGKGQMEKMLQRKKSSFDASIKSKISRGSEKVHCRH